MIQNKIFRTGILVVMPVIFGILLVSTQAFAFCPPTCAPKADYTAAMMTGNASSLSTSQQPNNSTITVTTDKPTYVSGEIIAVSGHVTNSYPGQDVAMKLTSTSGNVLFATQIALDNNGNYSTTINTAALIQNGQYTIYVQQGDEQARTAQTQFNLSGLHNQIQYTSGGTFQIVFSTNPTYPSPGSQTSLQVSFFNSGYLQPNIDFKVSVMEGNNQVFSIPITHTEDGTYSIPVHLQDAVTYKVIVEVDGMLFRPIPPETATFTVTTQQTKATTTTVTPNLATFIAGNPITFTATVADTSSSPTNPTGTVTWSDGGANGVFTPASCEPSSDICTTSYDPSTTSLYGPVTITASYGGDSTHSVSTGTSTLTVSSSSGVNATVPNPSGSITASTDKSSYEPGDRVIITGMVQQPTNENPVTIIVRNSTGGIYAVGQVTLFHNEFSHNFVLNDNVQGGIYTVSIRQSSETTQVQFQVTVRQIQVIPVFDSEIIVRGENTSLVEYGNVEVSTVDHSITIQVDTTKIQNGFITEEYQIPKHVIDTPGGQIAVKENGNDVDCIQTESDVERILDCPMQAGTNQLMFVGTVVIPESASTPQPQSAPPSTPPSTPPSVPSPKVLISIVSVQATDQQGNSVSSFTRGTNCYVKVILNSQSNTPSLMTVDLFGSDSVSLGVGSVKSTFGAGQSSITLSFPIPNDATVGQDNIYVDTYSDWISRGGIPLTPEYSSTVEVK